VVTGLSEYHARTKVVDKLFTERVNSILRTRALNVITVCPPNLLMWLIAVASNAEADTSSGCGHFLRLRTLPPAADVVICETKRKLEKIGI